MLLITFLYIGLELSRLADLPSEVTEEGRRVAYALAEREARELENSRSTQFAQRRRTVLEVQFHFLMSP